MWRRYSSLLATDGVRLQRDECTGVQEHAKDNGWFRSQISGPSSAGNICSQDLGVWETVEECARVHDVATLYNALHGVASYRLDKPETLKFNFKDAPYLTDEPLKAMLLSKPAGKETYLQALHFIRGPLFREGPPPMPPKGPRQGSGGRRHGSSFHPRQRPKVVRRTLKGGTWTVEGRTWRKRLTESDIKVLRVLIKPHVLEVLFGYKSTAPAEECGPTSVDPPAETAAAAAAARGAGEGSSMQSGDHVELAGEGRNPSNSVPSSSDPSWTETLEGQEKGGARGSLGSYKRWRALPEPVLASYSAEGDPQPQLWLLRFNSAGKDGFMLQPKTLQHLLSELELKEGDALVLEATSNDPLKPTANLSVERAAAAAAAGQEGASGSLGQGQEGEQQRQHQGIEREGREEEEWDQESGGEEEEGDGAEIDEMEGEQGRPRQRGLNDRAGPVPSSLTHPSLHAPSPMLIRSQPVICSVPCPGPGGLGIDGGGAGPSGIPSKSDPAFPIHQRPQQGEGEGGSQKIEGGPPPSKRARAAAAVDSAGVMGQQQRQQQQQRRRQEPEPAMPQPQSPGMVAPAHHSGAPQPHTAVIPAVSLKGQGNAACVPGGKQRSGGALALARRIIKRASKAATTQGRRASGGGSGPAAAVVAGLQQCPPSVKAPPPLQQATIAPGGGGLESPGLQLPAGNVPLTPSPRLEG